MSKIIVINDCYDCPYHSRGMLCLLKKKLTDDRFIRDENDYISEWCPLEDKKDI